MAKVFGEVNDMKSAADHLLPARDIAPPKAWINAGADWPGERRTNQTKAGRSTG